VLVLGERLSGAMAALLERGLSLDRAQAFDPAAAIAGLTQSGLAALTAIAPLLALLAAAALLAPLALGGLAFSTKAVAPQWARLDPLRGLKRVFSWQGLVELVKALAKFALLGAIAFWLLRRQAAEYLALGNEALEPALAHAARLIGWSFLWVSLGMILIAALDVPFQLWQHARNLRMTRQEVRDELKETEGRPEVKSQIRRLQRERAQRRMMAEVPKADVVITNPQHYACALRYDAARMRAPRLVAKGAGPIAARIRELATAHRVPQVETPPLARALYFNTELEQEIPQGLYLAVAQVLSYVYHLRQGRAAAPPDPDIPPEYRRS
jgi:flagellar biosynthetic protein FlhB